MNDIPETGVPLIIPGEPSAQELQTQLLEEKKSLPEIEVSQSASKLPEFPRSTTERKPVDPLRNFKEKMKAWPIHLSYEGSAVLCVMFALGGKTVLPRLPKPDQDLIHNALGGVELYSNIIEIKFDDLKDFILTFEICNGDTTERREIIAFNTVAHPRPEDLKDSCSVKIEEKGDKIQVGGKITLNKNTIDKIINEKIPKIHERSLNGVHVEEESSKKQSGKNAYEIRADVLQMAVDWGMRETFTGSEDDVLKVAKKFYAFVENKR